MKNTAVIRILTLVLFSGLSVVFCASCNTENTVFVITESGARGDGVTLNTVVIQKCIDAASRTGGTVIVPPGRFVTGTLFIKSNVTFTILNGGVLLGSMNLPDYPLVTDSSKHYCCSNRHLIIIDNAHNVTLNGQGLIDGQGHAFRQKPENPYTWIKAKEPRPDAMIIVRQSSNVTFSDLSFTNPPNWTVNIYRSEKIFIRGINITNDLLSPNSDGFDISGSSDVIISDCYIHTCDDAIVLNAVPGHTRRVTVTNCNLKTLCAAVKIGWPEKGNFNISQVTVSNCNIWQSNRGIAVYSCNGGDIEDISVTNINFESNTPVMYTRPVHIDLRNNDSVSAAGHIRNVSITNMICRTQGRILVTAQQGTWIENLTLSNIKMIYPYIEDPAIVGTHPRSKQSSFRNPEARVARAAVVAENVRTLIIRDVTVVWPEDSIPAEWKIKVKIENGTHDLHSPDYSVSQQVPFSVLWLKGITGAVLDNPLAKASASGVPRYIIVNSQQIIQ